MTYGQRLVQWTTLWHADEGGHCDIQDALEEYNKGKINLTELIDVINDVDDGCIKSFFNLEEGIDL